MNFGITNDNTKYLLLNNKPIEEKLHVVAVVSNPCNFKIRYKLTNEFIKRMEKEPNVILYVVELVYNNQEFEITSADNKSNKHLYNNKHSCSNNYSTNQFNLLIIRDQFKNKPFLENRQSYLIHK
jgi:hypothetical protein